MPVLFITICIHFAKPVRIAKGTAIVAATLALIVTLSVARADEVESSKISGKVTDAAGHPIAGAEVYVNRYEGQPGPAEQAGRAWTSFTDKYGRYEFTLRYPKGQKIIANEVFAEMKGYVCGWSKNDISFHDGNSATLDFHLNKGEVIAGTIRLPPITGEQYDSADPTTWPLQILSFTVEGPNVERMPVNARLHSTDKKGRFELYVPPGEYTLRVDFDADPVDLKGVKSGQRGLELSVVPPFEWTPKNVGGLFDELWETMDQYYSYFFLKKDVDWKALRDKVRPAAMRAKNAVELTAALKDLLAPLNDMHVWIETPTGIVSPMKGGGYVFNGNRDATLSELVDRVDCGKFAAVGKTKKDRFGYVLMLKQGAATEEDVKKAVQAIRKLHDVPGFIVDLRTANGGSEPLAREIASQFCAKETVYAKSKYREGPGHDQFGKVYDRLLPAAPDAYVKPVVCLIGPGAVSSGEGFVEMMKCLPYVTTVGMPTRGASGNPSSFPLGRTRVVVYYSSWVDMLPDGETFEGVGIAPKIRVDLPNAAYANADPTLKKGLEVLRSKLAAAK